MTLGTATGLDHGTGTGMITTASGTGTACIATPGTGTACIATSGTGTAYVAASGTGMACRTPGLNLVLVLYMGSDFSINQPQRATSLFTTGGSSGVQTARSATRPAEVQ